MMRPDFIPQLSWQKRKECECRHDCCCHGWKNRERETEKGMKGIDGWPLSVEGNNVTIAGTTP